MKCIFYKCRKEGKICKDHYKEILAIKDWENQNHYKKIKNKELYLIEDALIYLRDNQFGTRTGKKDKKYKEIDNILQKIHKLEES